ncbi:Putative uncharacterized protein, partial [Pararhodospirillum photometricum DSM 122]
PSGTGQASDPIRRLATSQSPVFLVNSRHPLVCAPSPWLPKTRAPFSRSYGGILPSSFNTILSSALVYSTSPPVSVWGTVHTWGYFLAFVSCPVNPIRPDNVQKASPSTSSGLLT